MCINSFNLRPVPVRLAFSTEPRAAHTQSLLAVTAPSSAQGSLRLPSSLLQIYNLILLPALLISVTSHHFPITQAETQGLRALPFLLKSALKSCQFYLCLVSHTGALYHLSPGLCRGLPQIPASAHTPCNLSPCCATDF